MSERRKERDNPEFAPLERVLRFFFKTRDVAAMYPGGLKARRKASGKTKKKMEEAWIKREKLLDAFSVSQLS